MGFFSDNFTFQPGLFHGYGKESGNETADPMGQDDSLLEEIPLGGDLEILFGVDTEQALLPEYTRRALPGPTRTPALPGPTRTLYIEKDDSFSSQGKTLGSTTDISGLGGRFNNNPRPFSNNTRKDYFWGVMGDEYLAQMRNEFDDIW